MRQPKQASWNGMSTLAMAAALLCGSRGVHAACEDNPIVYDVNIDIQAEFDGMPSTCDSGKWNEISLKITETLNSKFTSVVPEWVGDVDFGSTAFDVEQEVSNVGRRMLRGLQQQGQRRLSTCPVTRAGIIECEMDVCYWGCLIAPTTSCGVNELTNWAVLADEIKAALAALNYECLGMGDSLMVEILVVEPDGEGPVDPTQLDPDVAFEDLASGPTLDATMSGGEPDLSEADDSTLDATLEEADDPTLDAALEEANDPTLDATLEETDDPTWDATIEETDVVTKDLVINSRLTITFFTGKGALPDDDEIATAEAAVVEFFKARFQADDDFAPVFYDLQITGVTPKYEFAKPDEFILEYTATVSINEESDLKAMDAANVMAGADFKDFINDVMRTQGSELQNTFKVHFRAATRGNRM